MVNARFDDLWPWLRIAPREDPSGLGEESDGVDPMLGSSSFGLSRWRPPNSLQQPPWLEIEAQRGPLHFWGDVGAAEPMAASRSAGLSSWRPPEQSLDSANAASPGLSSWRPPFSLDQPGGSVDDVGAAKAMPFDAEVATFPANPGLEKEWRLTPQSWWPAEYGGIPKPDWSLLGAETGHEWPASDADAGASKGVAGALEFNPLSVAGPILNRPAALQKVASADSSSHGGAPASLGDLHPTGLVPWV